MKAGANSSGARNASSSPVGVSAEAAQARARLKKREGYASDRYFGTAADLIAAGLISPEQFPEKSMATYWHGQRVKQGTNSVRREGFMQVQRSGGKFWLEVGVSEQEQKRRREANPPKLPSVQSAQSGDGGYYANPENLRSLLGDFLRNVGLTIFAHCPEMLAKLPALQDRKMFAARVSESDAVRVYEALCEVQDLLGGLDLQRMGASSVRIEAARTDAAFQSFLSAQCLKAE